ncbi:MAG: hypothetical protein CYPHOPRED_003118 [Cyphobasidiales sp. Tagirdzhanova-0007]|nr:MAG: hypothetical protein CYPHOPRED_003118 [Cyphobasidiales sp. Tagirdzhanova-0007]
MANTPIPIIIVKLYRRVLRQAGAAVLFSKPAMPNLRRLYRAEFDIWMTRAKGGPREFEQHREEWEEFARRAQSTLILLHRASTTNDIPHKLTAGLANMQYHMDPSPLVASRRSATASSSLQMSRPEFILGKKGRDTGEVEKIYAWDAFAEVAGMAEGSAGLLLGRVRPRKND